MKQAIRALFVALAVVVALAAAGARQESREGRGHPGRSRARWPRPELRPDGRRDRAGLINAKGGVLAARSSC